MGRLERLRVYPVKSLDGVSLDAARITPGGVLGSDRAYALFDAGSEPVTARREGRLHELHTAFDPESQALTVRPPDGEARRFDLAGNRDSAAVWFSAFLDTPVTVRRDATDGFADRRHAGHRAA